MAGAGSRTLKDELGGDPPAGIAALRGCPAGRARRGDPRRPSPAGSRARRGGRQGARPDPARAPDPDQADVRMSTASSPDARPSAPDPGRDPQARRGCSAVDPDELAGLADVPPADVRDAARADHRGSVQRPRRGAQPPGRREQAAPRRGRGGDRTAGLRTRAVGPRGRPAGARARGRDGDAAADRASWPTSRSRSIPAGRTWSSPRSPPSRWPRSPASFSAGASR